MVKAIDATLFTIPEEPQTKVVTWNHDWLRNFAISEIFFRVFRAYIPLVGDLLHVFWLGIREFYNRCHIFVLQTTVQGLQTKVHSLSLQIHHMAGSVNGLIFEKTQLIEERDSAINTREQAVLSRAPILTQLDTLKTENEELKNKVRDLNKVSEEKEDLKNKYRETLLELGAVNGQLERAKQTADFTQHVNELFRQMQEIPVNGNGEVAQMALQRLPQIAKEHKEKFHTTLRDAIATMDPTDPATVSLNGILRVSQTEVNHLEWVTKIFQLLEALRQPLNTYVTDSQSIIRLEV